MAELIGNIWHLSDDDRFNKIGRAAPDYLTPEQRCRYERIRQCRMLYGGKHQEYFLGERRSKFNFNEVRAEVGIGKMYIKYNLLRRVTHTSADLLFGDDPIIRVEDAIQSDKLKAFADRTDLDALFIELEIECSSVAECVLEACIMDGESYLVLIPAEEIHPLGRMRPDRQYSAYVRYAEQNVGTRENPITLILATTYLEGSIERRVYRGSVKDENRVALESWPEFKINTPPEKEITGIPYNTIIWFPNMIITNQVVSDYDGSVDLQDALNANHTQVKLVIQKHASPKLRAPRSAADKNGNVQAGREVVYSDNPDDWGYLTWDAQLSAAFKDREDTEHAICISTETSPALLGLDRTGTPDSARALKLKCTASIAKAKRKSKHRKSCIRWALHIVQLLDQTIPGNRYDMGPVTFEPRDGMPVDEDQLIQGIVSAKAAKVMSTKRAVDLQISDPKQAQVELHEINRETAEERQANTPPILFEKEITPTPAEASAEDVG